MGEAPQDEKVLSARRWMAMTGLLASMSVAALLAGSRLWSPLRLLSAPSSPTPVQSTPLAVQEPTSTEQAATPVPTLPGAVPIEVVHITPSSTAVPYSIQPVEPPDALGIARLYIATFGDWSQQPAIDPRELRLPTTHIRPDTGRYAEIRGTWRLTHLGSDYLPVEEPLVPPSEHAILAATVYLQRSTYTAIALDMSGNIQIYLVTLITDTGPHPYLFCYAHLRHTSNELAIEQALSSGGYVETMGKVDIVGADNPNLSDMHIGVIDVIALLDFTGQNNIQDALVELFSDRLERTHQQYPQIFVRPEDVFPALDAVLTEYEGNE